MDINAAKCAFKNILNSLTADDRVTFLSWCEENYAGLCNKFCRIKRLLVYLMTAEYFCYMSLYVTNTVLFFFLEINDSKSYFELRTIAEDIKTMIPAEAVLPSETVDNSRIESVS